MDPEKPTPNAVRQRRRGGNRRRYALLSLASVTLVVAAWVVLTIHWPSRGGPLVDSLKLPGPPLVWQAVRQLGWNLGAYAGVTFLRVAAGLAIGAVFGLVIALLMTWSPVVAALIDPLVEALRPCPPVALTPFVILWFGLGSPGQIFIIALACFMVTVVNVTVAVSAVERRYIWAARSLGADTFTLYRTVIWPAIMPSLVSGLRVAAATGFGATIAAEYLGAQGGLGYMIRNARTTLNTESILLGAILLGVESWLLDRGIRAVGDRLTYWQERPFGHVQEANEMHVSDPLPAGGAFESRR